MRTRDILLLFFLGMATGWALSSRSAYAGPGNDAEVVQLKRIADAVEKYVEREHRQEISR